MLMPRKVKHRKQHLGRMTGATKGAASVTFRAPVDFLADTRTALRAALIDPEDTDAYRILHGGADGWPGWYVDRLGDFLLSHGEHAPNTDQGSVWNRCF